MTYDELLAENERLARELADERRISDMLRAQLMGHVCSQFPGHDPYATTAAAAGTPWYIHLPHREGL